LLYGRPRNSPTSSFLTPNLKNGCTRQPSSIKCFESRWLFFHFFFSTLLFISFLFLHIEIEVLKFFDATISDFSLVVKKVLDMIPLSSYIQNGGCRYGRFVFFWEFKLKDGIRRIKFWGQQLTTKKMSNEFCIGIPIIQLHSIFKLLQIDFWVFLGKHICFCITTKLPFILVLKVGKLVTIYQIYLWRCYSLCYKYLYHVLLFHGAIY
jgi:hypothetical protein